MTSSVLVVPLLVNILVAYYIRKRASENVSGRATWILVGLVVAIVAIYVPSLFDLNRAQAALTGAIPDFIEANVVWGGWWLTEAWLTTAIFDAVYTLSKTDLPYVRELRWLMHLAVGIGFFMLTYSYFAPYINKIIATNQTQPSNQTS